MQETPAPREGVIKFELDFSPAPAPAAELLVELNRWRQVFRELGLLGQDPLRYGGDGFGNLSRRLPEREDGAFLISGTQTGHLQTLQPEDYASVLSCDPDANFIRASGQIKPSSEALSHGVLYQALPEILWVMHLHSPDIFAARARLHLPCTDPSAAYGTPDMARGIRRLAEDSDRSGAGLLVMSGHPDGVLAYGPTAEATATLVLSTLVKARQGH